MSLRQAKQEREIILESIITISPEGFNGDKFESSKFLAELSYKYNKRRRHYHSNIGREREELMSDMFVPVSSGSAINLQSRKVAQRSQMTKSQKKAVGIT